jgi:hypothetical protein
MSCTTWVFMTIIEKRIRKTVMFERAIRTLAVVVKLCFHTNFASAMPWSRPAAPGHAPASPNRLHHGRDHQHPDRTLVTDDHAPAAPSRLHHGRDQPHHGHGRPRPGP